MLTQDKINELKSKWRSTKMYQVLVDTWGDNGKTLNGDTEDFFISQIETILKEPHETKDGYCCACDYDIACFDGKLKEQRESLVEKGNGLKKIFQYSENWDKDEIHNQAIEDYQNLIKEDIKN